MANGNQANQNASQQPPMGMGGGVPQGANPTDPTGVGGGNIGTGNISQPGETSFPSQTPQTEEPTN